jgi:hypothetical protein
MLLPAATEAGDAELVVTRSACVPNATTSAAVAVLFAEFESVTDELTVAVSLITVPAAVPAVTFTTTGKLAVPGAKLGFVQLMTPALPTAGSVQDHPLGSGVSDTKVVFGGVFSVKLAPVAVLGPPLVTICVYVILLPACTGTGLAVFVTDISAESATTVLTDALLFPPFGSTVVDETVSVSVIVVPDATVEFTFTTKVKLPVPPEARVAMVH